MTWREYVTAVRGFDRRRCKEFEHTRAICFFVMSYGFKENKTKINSMQEMWPLPTDIKEDIETEGMRLKKIMEQTRKQLNG
jgi:hypothetical protein